ncbi:MAG TPA: P-loop NTPase fold protein [Solirubrobacteraceae bacterium]|nr:P-loop NTPase fold protein [Solirubrobacteraceae bacterium]
MANAPAPAPGTAEFTLLGDQPYRAGGDPLGFDALAQDLCRLVLASKASTPFTLGVEAGWGRGKSTLMHRLRAHLDEAPDVRTVWFNAWTSGEGGVLEGLMKTVLAEMEPRSLRRALRNEQLMSWLRVGATIVGGWLGLSSLVDQLWQRVAVDPRARNELQSLVRKAMEDWRHRDGGVPGGRLLCVFVDDLDRCSPAGVFEVFEAIKLYLDAEGLVFVIGFDADIVSSAILHQKQYGKSVKSRDYLEKIVQVAYRIPTPGAHEASALIAGYMTDSGTTDLFGPAERSLVMERNERNPRRIKRFINGFILQYGLTTHWQEFAPEILIRAHLLYMYFPDFARLLDRPAERDAVAEFLDYRAARDALRQGADRKSDEWGVVEQAFRNYGLRPPAFEWESLLRTLDQYVPVSFPALAADHSFASLVRTLAQADEWPRLRQRLAEGGPRPGATDEPEPTEPAPARLEGLRVLWVDDRPEGNEGYAEAIRRAGGTVVQVRDVAEARKLLAQEQYEILLSDVSREGRAEAGLEDLERLRDEGVAPERAIFFTSRVTPSREARAAALRAHITSEPRALFDLLARAEPPPDPTDVLRRGDAEGDADASLQLGRLLVDRGQLGEAADAYRRAADRGSGQAALALGEILWQLGDVAGATAAFQHAIESGDADRAPLAVFNLGVVYEEAADTDRAEAAYRIAVDSDHPEAAPRAMLALGALLEERGDTARAGELYERARASGHADVAPRAAYRRAEMLDRAGEVRRALVAYEDAIALATGTLRVRAAMRLARMLEHRGDVQGALSAYEMAIESGDPELAPRAALNVGMLLDASGLAGAAEAYRTAIDSGHQEYAPHGALKLGELLAERGDAAGARKAYRFAIDSWHAIYAKDAAMRLGELSEREGDIAGARQAYETAEDLRAAGAWEALQRLEDAAAELPPRRGTA